jgi:hypothetical protein
VVKAGLNFIPLVGGALASLVGDYVPTSTQKSVERALELLKEELGSLEGRIDIEAVDKEDFSDLFKSCYLVIVRSNREEKLRAAAALLANMLLRPGDLSKSSYEEIDHLVRCVDALSIGAISVLIGARDLSKVHGQNAQGRFTFDQLRKTFPQFNASLLMSLVSELRALNLLDAQEGLIRMPDHGGVSLEMTPIGRRLVERFIEGKM